MLRPSLQAGLASDRTLVAAGVFDGLSAMLAARAGYDAVWASGFSICAAKGLPDLNVLSITELIQSVGEIVDSCAAPVIVDCDEGHGALPTTLRLVRGLVARGAHALCIEDSIYPKVNSFSDGLSTGLMAPSEFGDKIAAIKDAAPSTVVIARTESLIQGEAMPCAVERGLTYAARGADLVLLHSKFVQYADYAKLRACWTDSTPLIVIPTLATAVRLADFAALGFRMVIYANQAVRASIRSMQQVLDCLRATGDLTQVSDLMVPMSHIFDLTGLYRVRPPYPP